MGLDTSHDCWHGAYSAFSRWRNQLARVAGYEVKPVKYGGVPYETAQIDWDAVVEKNYTGEWDQVPADPLVLLIAHSDCEGVIKAEHCALLADRLEELLPKLDGDGGGHVGLYRDKTRVFIDGLRRAAAAGEDVDFH